MIFKKKTYDEKWEIQVSMWSTMWVNYEANCMAKRDKEWEKEECALGQELLNEKKRNIVWKKGAKDIKSFHSV